MKWFILNVGEILIDKKYIPIIQSSTWRLTNGYIHGSSGKYKGKFLHRIIAELAGLDFPDQIDHKDRNPRNNLLSNLRPATHAQNRMNCKISSNNTSGYPGVIWDKKAQKWRAQIRVNRKLIHLGLFDDPKEAYAAYCKAARKYFDEFARTEETYEN